MLMRVRDTSAAINGEIIWLPHSIVIALYQFMGMIPRITAIGFNCRHGNGKRKLAKQENQSQNKGVECILFH